jgi:DNA polymerase V
MTAIEKMRAHRLAARSLTVFIETSRFDSQNFYSESTTYKSAYPSDDLFEIQGWATQSIEKIYREKFSYKKCGVILGGLIPAESVTNRLHESERQNPKRERLNRAIDELNKKFGKGTVRLAIAHAGKWQMKREKMSPRYTTRINEIIQIH